MNSRTKAGVGHPKASRRGFTITELLFTLTTLCMLLSLAVSAGTHSKDQVRITQCAANVRQFSQAMILYAEESRGQLPSANSVGGYWPWDLPAHAGAMLTQWMPRQRMYCPGTSERFTEEHYEKFWNFTATLHVVGYALTAPGYGLSATNQNSAIVPRSLSDEAALPSKRVLLADATISENGQFDGALRHLFNWTSLSGGFAGGSPPPPFVSAHLVGRVPAGGNVGLMDGHVEWRPFEEMKCRVNPGIPGIPGFWW